MNLLYRQYVEIITVERIIIRIPSLYILLFYRGCSYERYTVPYDRSYKRMVREEYITKCGPWSWKSCVKTRSVTMRVFSIIKAR